MKYYVDYQYMPKGADRPEGPGDPVAKEIDKDALLLLPNVGDFVQMIALAPGASEFSGRVRSRMFRHYGAEACSIYIVVEETDDDWAALSKD